MQKILAWKVLTLHRRWGLEGMGGGEVWGVGACRAKERARWAVRGRPGGLEPR